MLKWDGTRDVVRGRRYIVQRERALERLRFRCYGLGVEVAFDRPELAQKLIACLPPHRGPHHAGRLDRCYRVITLPGRRFALHVDDTCVASGHSERGLRELLEGDLNLYVAEWARERIFVHAGVVAWEGRALVLPGASFSGKSRLVAALIAQGAVYYSDEYAVLDPRGRVHPFRRRLTLRREAGGPARRIAVEGPDPDAPLPIALVAFCRYRASARWRPRVLSPGEGTLAFLASTIPARSRPEAALSVLSRVAGKARLLKGTRGEAELAARALLASLEATGSRRA